MVRFQRSVALLLLLLISYNHVRSFFVTKNYRLIISNHVYESGQGIPINGDRSTNFRSELFMGASIATQQAFNPFKARQHTSPKASWFDPELASFYDFVERQPLLNQEQELQYGKAVAMWNKVKKLAADTTSVAAVATMTSQEIADAAGLPLETVEKMQKFESVAMNKLINSNLKLVLAVVSRYRNINIANSEMISEGTKGLAKAASRYDYSKGYRFATYATWYVHQAVSEYVRWRKHPAKMPSRYLLLMRKVKQFSSDFKNEHGCSPTIAQISEALKQSHYDIVKVLNMQTFPLLTSSPIQTATAKLDNNTPQILEGALPSGFEAPIIRSDNENLRRGMEQLMCDSLNDVERDVLRLRLGFDDGRAIPMKEVGKKFHISWKQVRNVEKGALGKLKGNENFSDFTASIESHDQILASV